MADCFKFQLHQSAQNRPGRILIMPLTLEFGGIVVLPIGAMLILGLFGGPEVSNFLDAFKPEDRSAIFVNFIKLMSLALLYIHIKYIAPHWMNDKQKVQFLMKIMKLYEGTRNYVILAFVVLTIYTIFLGFIPLMRENVAQYLGCWLRNIFFVSFLAIVSFLYMGMYWRQHQTVINDNPNQPGIERWASAYIYGVDLPSIIALSLIIFISLLSHFQNTFVGDPRPFL